MDKQLKGLHHVTAIAEDPQRNVDFYTGVLGLRLVKQTVNFDDPDTYHLYYGDETGKPGTLLTFFLWPGAAKGRLGTGQLTVTSFSIPEGAMGHWMERFKRHGIRFKEPITRFDGEVLEFLDPDDLKLELVANPARTPVDAWKAGPVGEEYAIRGLYGVTLSEARHGRTESMLAETLDFRLVGESGSRFRYEVGPGGPGSLVDVISTPDEVPGIVSVGTVHHVAWLTCGNEEQRAWRQDIVKSGLNVTPVIDRRYFHSIYFREPGGVLFEIATDPLGFTVDEPLEELGTHLVLPPWLEHRRATIEERLPKLRVPQTAHV